MGRAHTYARTHACTHAYLCFLLGLDKFLPVLIVLSNVHHHSRDGKEFWTMWEQTCYCKTLTLAYMRTSSPHTHEHTQLCTSACTHSTFQIHLDEFVISHICTYVCNTRVSAELIRNADNTGSIRNADNTGSIRNADNTGSIRNANNTGSINQARYATIYNFFSYT